jgi:tetratricopeptide (TPR) repeat protein
MMDLISPLGRRAAMAAGVMLTALLSACAGAVPSGAADYPAASGAYGAFLAARYADSQNDPAAATRYYTQALRADPANPALLSEGFLAALLAGSPRAQTLAVQVPGNALATMLLGNQAALQGNFGQAIQQFSSLPQDDLSGVIKPLLVAWSQFGQGNAQAALTGLGPQFNSGAFGAVYVLNAGLIADASNDDKDATQLYAAVQTEQPDLRMAEILASWYARQGNLAEASGQLAALAAAHPDLQIALPGLQAQMSQPVINTATQGLAEAYLTLAGSLDQPSQRFLCVTFLRFALALRPDLSAARLLLANTQAGGTSPSVLDMQNALATLQPIATTDALYGPAALQQANLLAALNRPSEAVALLNGLIAASPADPELLDDAGDLLRGAGQFAAAIGYYDKAIAALGNPPPSGAWTLYFDRGICEDQLNNWTQAEPDMLQARSLAPNQPYVLNYLGYSWAQRGENLPQAKAMLTQAAQMDPADGAVIDSLGYVNLRQGDTKAAVALLTQAVELDPDDAEVNAHLGDAYWQNGQKLQADYQWQRALALKPDDKLRAGITAKLQQYFAPPA